MSSPGEVPGGATEPSWGERRVEQGQKRLPGEQPQEDRSERSSSPVPSVLSMKSDMSNTAPLNFTAQQRATDVSAGRVLCDVCSNPAVKKCLTCDDFYCGTHVRDHYTSPDLEGHQLQDLQNQSRCKQHKRDLEFYCRTDQSAICSRCLLHNHKGHDIIELEETDTDQNKKEQCIATKIRDIPRPGSIQFPSVEPNSVTVSWSPPEGAPGSYRYKVTWKGGQKKHRMVVAVCEVEVTGLVPAERYHFTVSTLSEDDHQSTCVEASVYTDVPVPENLTVDSSLGSLKWTKPEGVDEVSYLLELFSISSGERLKSIYTTDDNYSISDLAKHGQITVHVSSLTNGRQSKPNHIFTTGDLRIILLGKTGCGKSATGNTILGFDAFREESSTNSVTNVCQRETATVNGRRITVVDTPGFFDTDGSKETKREIMRCMDLAAPGPHMFLLVIAAGPFTQEERDTIQRIKDMFGEEFLEHTIVLFTRKDLLQRSFEEYLEKAHSKLKELLQQCGDRNHSFNNRDRGANGQVAKLLDKINDTLVINEGNYYTTDFFHKINGKGKK